MPSSDSVQRYIERVRPMCEELYRRAQVITGNADMAEFVLVNAITDAYARRHDWQGRIAFREEMNTSVREEALDELNRALESGSYERDPDDVLARSMYGVARADAGDAAQQLVENRILREKPALQRMLMLRYGCGLSTKEIAFVLQIKHNEVRDGLRLFSIRTERALKKLNGQAGTLDKRLAQLSEEALKRPGGDAPDMSTIFQLFDDTMRSERRGGARIGRVVRAVLMVLGALICALLFWLIAVLLEPRLSDRRVPQDTYDEMQYDLAIQKRNDINVFFT